MAILPLLLFSTAAHAQVNRTIGTLPPGGTVTITFDVTVNSPFPANISSVTNQGSVSAGGLVTMLTDDPAVAGISNATVTTVFVAPQITCPSDITTNAAGYCVPAIAFASTVTAGVPLPVVSYKIGTTNITSPFTFPIGTNIVTSIATNAAGTNTCNFNVIVAPGDAPQLDILRTGTNVVVSWTNAYPCYTFQFSSLLLSNSWSTYAGPFATNNGKIVVTNSAPFTNRFFRLKF
jgi:hypothetical protein